MNAKERDEKINELIGTSRKAEMKFRGEFLSLMAEIEMTLNSIITGYFSRKKVRKDFHHYISSTLVLEQKIGLLKIILSDQDNKELMDRYPTLGQNLEELKKWRDKFAHQVARPNQELFNTGEVSKKEFILHTTKRGSIPEKFTEEKQDIIFNQGLKCLGMLEGTEHLFYKELKSRGKE